MLLGKNFQLYNKVVFSRFPIFLLLISLEQERRIGENTGNQVGCLCDKLISGGGQERTYFSLATLILASFGCSTFCTEFFYYFLKVMGIKALMPSYSNPTNLKICRVFSINRRESINHYIICDQTRIDNV